MSRIQSRIQRLFKKMLFWLAVPLCFISRKTYFTGLRWKGLPASKVMKGAYTMFGEPTWNFPTNDLPEGYAITKDVGKA